MGACMVDGAGDLIPELDKYPINLLLIYLFDFFNSHQDHVLDFPDIYLLSQILTEQIRRHMHGNGKNMNIPHVFFMH
jgi:hypothetical protein